jgi:hypothetical protein
MTAKILPNIIRTPRTSERPFFSSARDTAQDNRISFEARGVLWYLLSKPDDWKVQWKDIAIQGKFGRDKAKAALKELRDAGYIETEMIHDKRGKFGGKTDRVYETPRHNNPIEAHRGTEKPSHGQSVQRKTRHIHITEDIQNTETNAAIAAQPKPVEEPQPPLTVLEARDESVFDVIAVESFGLKDSAAVKRAKAGGRIGKLVSWLKETYPGATVKTARAFYAWYDEKHPGADRPCDPVKFSTHFTKFHDFRTAQKDADQKADTKQAEAAALWEYERSLIEGRSA